MLTPMLLLLFCPPLLDGDCENMLSASSSWRPGREQKGEAGRDVATESCGRGEHGTGGCAARDDGVGGMGECARGGLLLIAVRVGMGECARGGLLFVVVGRGCCRCGAGEDGRGIGTGPEEGPFAWLACEGRGTGEEALEADDEFPALGNCIACWNKWVRGAGDGARFGSEGCPADGSSRGDSLPDRTLASSFFSSWPLLLKRPARNVRLEGDGFARGAGDRPRRGWL